jgi:hypothetical protein
MTTELHEGPLQATRVLDAPPKLSWREKRERRRRRRVWFEEILGWILVPAILFGGYWLSNVALEAVGTSPAAILDGIHAVMAHL